MSLISTGNCFLFHRWTVWIVHFSACNVRLNLDQNAYWPDVKNYRTMSRLHTCLFVSIKPISILRLKMSKKSSIFEAYRWPGENLKYIMPRLIVKRTTLFIQNFFTSFLKQKIRHLYKQRATKFLLYETSKPRK